MDNTVKNGRLVVRKEKKAIADLEKRFLNRKFQKSFLDAVNLIYKCKGKVIITGIGKSGIIAQKITSTFNSTGTYSMFLHSAESIHGDLGIIKKEDIVIIISKSGDTAEIKKIIPLIKQNGNKIILLTGNPGSVLAKSSDIILDISVSEEACPHNLAPTSSSTASLVMGDALAVALLQKRKFTKEEFAQFHPGGSLGRKLLLRVDDIMVKGKDLPVVDENEEMGNVIYTISSKRLGCAVVLSKGKISGIVTDGDLRRMLEKTLTMEKIRAKDVMSKNPKMIPSSTLAVEALEMMETNKITQLIISNDKKKIDGIIHIHTLVELGLK
ncbi:MAG: KpsF/GutQ family sugar-phosphate isomerase [Ignavibacteria bacterium]|nr:KpsF/GutQ family sugar-phosphate isomerase [Ignavibacteria bacterium]